MRSNATSQESWSLPARIAFRFGLITAALLFSNFPLYMIPGGARIGAAVAAAWYWIVRWFSALFGIDLPPLLPTGSGDTLFHYMQLALIAVVAVIGTLVWSAFAKRRAYPRLAAGATVLLRYFLASVMIGYGMAKVVPMQFPPLWLGRYDHSLGDMSPMGLLWTFMGHSQAYTFGAGAAEIIGSVLLLSRRTYVIGATILAIVMTNVVALNFCYDVPVKLFSSELLAVCLVLIAPHARRLLCAFLGRATPEVLPRVRGSVAGERVRGILKLVAIALIALRAYDHYRVSRWIQSQRRSTPLYGIWQAERVVVDGVERPPLFTDRTRWRKLIFHEYGLTIRYATDGREDRRVEVDDKAHTITLMDGLRRVVWTYRRPDDTHLVIDAPSIHAELVLEPAPLLPTRGFHWVQETPFYR